MVKIETREKEKNFVEVVLDSIGDVIGAVCCPIGTLPEEPKTFETIITDDKGIEYKGRGNSPQEAQQEALRQYTPS